jgi:hypothetical protein
MHRGYIKVWRKIKESFVWQDAEVLKLWMHILIEANHKETEFLFNGQKQVLLRGQMICGRKKLADELKINENKLYRSLKLLESEQLIEQRKTNAFTVVSIVCYDKYHANEQPNEQPMNNQRTTNEQPMNTSKTLETLKELKEYSNIGADAPLFVLPENLGNTDLTQPKEKPQRKNSPQAMIMDSFRAKYLEWTGQTYDVTKQDYIILDGLIKTHGQELVTLKLIEYAKVCRQASEWFSKDGMRSFTIRKFKSHWNDVLIEKEVA